VGDGTTTFNVPDSRGRAIIGDGAGVGLTVRTLGQQTGAETHVLTTAQMPSHNHGGGTGNDSPDHSHGPGAGTSFLTKGGGAGETAAGGNGYNSTSGTAGASVRHTHSIGAEGSNNSHNNMQPSLVVKRAIKY
jgi:microcystin-dependent protein